MSIVTLVSGGLDSTLVAKLSLEEGIDQFPLFINYGQISKEKEYEACVRAMASLGLKEPKEANLSGFGALIRSGLTDPNLDVVEDAFTPGRNMLFLLVGAAYAFQVGADAVSIALLHEDTSLFPDQTSEFLKQAELMIECCLGKKIKVIAPLVSYYKKDVVGLAEEKGIKNTYSCHKGGENACGNCIACKEYNFEEDQNGRK